MSRLIDDGEIRCGRDSNPIPLRPIAHITCPDFELPDPYRNTVAGRHCTQKPEHPPQVAQDGSLSSGSAGTSDVLDVQLDVALTVTAEANDLLHPCPDLVVLMMGLGEVKEQAIHAPHLIVDELDITTEATKQLRLVEKGSSEAAQERVKGALSIHLARCCFKVAKMEIAACSSRKGA